MDLMKDIANIVETCELINFNDALKKLNFDKFLDEWQPGDENLNVRANHLMKMYEMNDNNPTGRYATARVIIRLNEQFVRESVKQSILKYLQTTVLSTNTPLLNKELSDYKAYLKYAACNWGNDDEVRVVERLIARIGDGKKVVRKKYDVKK